MRAQRRAIYHKRGLENQIAPNAEYRIEGDIEAFFEGGLMQKMFCLDGENEMIYSHTTESKRGFHHSKFRFFHRGIEAKDFPIIVHHKNGLLHHIYGSIPKGIRTMETANVLNFDSVLELFRNSENVFLFRWEDEVEELSLKQIKNDPDVSWKPNPIPILKPMDGGIRIVYETVIISKASPERFFKGWNYIIDATTGMVLSRTPTGFQCETNTVETLYDGLHSFNTEQLPPEVVGTDPHRLYDDCRLGHVHTKAHPILEQDQDPLYGLNNHVLYTWSLASEKINNGPVWSSPGNVFAASLHWGIQKSYDFFSSQYAFVGLDQSPLNPVKQAMRVLCVENHPNYMLGQFDDVEWIFGNAYFGFTNGGAIGGSTYGTDWNDLAALDIAGHEYAHAVGKSINGYNGYDYWGETGALMESVSDIFGAAIELSQGNSSADTLCSNFYAIGEDAINHFSGTHPHIRTFCDPNSMVNASFYHGDLWLPIGNDWEDCNADDGNDGCWVHFNCGVQNHWFYLMANGGTGSNGPSHDTRHYNIAGLGINESVDLVFYSLRDNAAYPRWQPGRASTPYEIAAVQTLGYAEMIYGTCSWQYKTVWQAWWAVGLRDSPHPPDWTFPCADGIQNYGESTVDCGGSCRPCDMPLNCSDMTMYYLPLCQDGLCISGLVGLNYDSSFGYHSNACFPNTVSTSHGPGWIYLECYEYGLQENIYLWDDNGCVMGPIHIDHDTACNFPNSPYNQNNLNCSDGIQNGDETAIDCGGSVCPDCPTCYDGIQNGLEEGVDCGGPCSDCGNCFDGIRNQGEQGIDCGGPCPDCDPPSAGNNCPARMFWWPNSFDDRARIRLDYDIKLCIPSAHDQFLIEARHIWNPRAVFSESVNEIPASLTIDTSRWPQGVYIVTLSDREGILQTIKALKL